MTQKRRNHGRSKHGRGHTERITCDGCRGLVAKVLRSVFELLLLNAIVLNVVNSF